MPKEKTECDKCGKCCESMFLWLGKRKPNDDYINWLNLHEGVKVVYECDAWGVRIPVRCSKLSKDGLCTIYKSLKRPVCCDQYNCWTPLFWPKP